jgi:thioredoxin 1
VTALEGMTISSVTADTFETEVRLSPLPVVIDFWAPRCAPCRALAPVLDELAARHAGGVKVVKIDAEAEPALAVAFGVRGVPTLAVVKDGRHVDGMPGFQGKAKVEALFERALAR